MLSTIVVGTEVDMWTHMRDIVLNNSVKVQYPGHTAGCDLSLPFKVRTCAPCDYSSLWNNVQTTFSVDSQLVLGISSAKDVSNKAIC